MNLHLSNNFVLREVFELGPPLPAYDPNSSSKLSKSERVRTVTRDRTSVLIQYISERSKSVGF